MRLMLCGLSAGLSIEHMRSLRVCDVANIVAELSDMRSESKQDDVRDATQADIDFLKSL